MSRPDHSTYREWLNLDADGGLDSGDRALLDEHLASCAECRREREELLALDGLLRSSALPVRPDFRAAVMSALPTVGWEARSPRAWRFTAAVIVLLGGFAAALLVAGSAPATSGFGTLAAVGGMLQASILAGAGLLGASWKGRAGLRPRDLLAREPRRVRLPGALPQPAPDLADPPPAAGRGGGALQDEPQDVGAPAWAPYRYGYPLSSRKISL
jgi:anti-sigma factor RsiW